MLSTFAKLLDTKSLLRLAASRKRATIVGCVDGAHRGQIRGWAIDLAAPASRLTVHMVSNAGETIAEALADRYRADVQKAGYGDGHHGFAVPAASPDVMAGTRFFCGKQRIELPRPRSIARRSGGKTFQRTGYVLCLDQRPSGAHLTGWAIDTHHPSDRRQLRLRAGHQVLSEQRATLFRPDCIDQGSDGFHGFSLPLSRHAGSLFIDDLASGLEFRIS